MRVAAVPTRMAAVLYRVAGAPMRMAALLSCAPSRHAPVLESNLGSGFSGVRLRDGDLDCQRVTVFHLDIPRASAPHIHRSRA